MSDSNHSEEQEKKHPFGALFFSLIVFAVLAALLFYQKKKIENDAPYDEFSLSKFIEYGSDFDLEKSTTPRIMGDKNAPVKIVEYNSFTCGACGLYRETTLKMIKENYIDTGKAYLVFNDMPRNVKDVTIGVIARCIPEKTYFEFLDLIFETQKEWMNSEDPIKEIKEKAVIAGASPELIDQCYYSKDLRKTLVKTAKEALKKHKLGRIPALVVNDTHIVIGYDPYEKIRDVIEEELAKAEAMEETKDVVTAPVAEEDGEEDTDQTKAPADIETASGEETTQIVLDIEKLTEPRILGNPDAPLKISDHSSFTCSACSRFRMESFEKIKTEYIDTGKAYLVFDDFPRNEPDIIIGAIARCVPESSYFKFIELIFKTRDSWIKNDDFTNFIKQNAKLTGADPELIDKCAESKELQKALATRGHSVYEELGVDSTPTFIINDNKRIVGAVSYSKFKKTLDTELTRVKSKE